jgi:hypothetical protein
MNKEQINLAITKVLNPKIPSYNIEENYEDSPHWNSGFYETTISFSDSIEVKFFGRRSEISTKDIENRYLEEKIKDYCGDLNAIHEAEKILSKIHKQTMTHYLDKLLCGKQAFLWEATAAQRAEAFLRTLNLWDAE